MHILTSVPSFHWDVVLGYQLINLSSHYSIKTYGNFVSMGAGERGGGGGVSGHRTP